MLRRFVYLLMTVAVVAGVPAFMPKTQPASASPVKALGAEVLQAKREVTPRDEVIVNDLTEAGVIKAGDSAAAIQTAVDQYKAEFAKKNPDWISAKAQKRAQDHEVELANTAYAPQGDPAPAKVSVKVFALAVDFGAVDEALTIKRIVNNVCTPVAEKHSGPKQGTIAAPSQADNNTLWYTPAQTADPYFYSKLIFGYEGVGRIRMDLVDPNDGKPGINLAGYTVQDYYDHFAGKGNVSLEGDVEGWVTVNHSEAYYGAPAQCGAADNDSGVAPVGQLVVDAVKQFQAAHPTYMNDTSSTAFWPQFDENHDGVVDTTWIIHAGRGEEAGGGNEGDDAVWSHSWAVSASVPELMDGFKVYEGDPATTADDIYVNPYTIQPEDADLGVFVEEFGHNFFDLPDLYTTDAENSVGDWSEMAGGSWMGPLGGTAPVGMPLWFRMIAWCGNDFCNWQYPMVTRDYQAASQDITLGALDGFPGGEGVNKGVRINLPPNTNVVENLAGTGKAAYSGTGINDVDSTLERTVNVPASGAALLSFNTYWSLEPDYDYGYVQVKDGDKTDFLVDQDKHIQTGVRSIGPALNGDSGAAVNLKFDLSAYAGKSVTLILRYITDPGTTGAGWWVDDFKMNDTKLDDFEGTTAFAGWTNASDVPWVMAPYSQTFPLYYLVEWRSTTKYDKNAQYAYVTTANTVDTWTVERVPYNIPGALVYLRDARYGEGYSQRQNYYDGPSFGPKNKLLVVDMNYDAFHLGTTTTSLNNRAASYDSALTLQPSKAFTLSSVYGVPGGPWNYVSKPAVTSFNDTKGYYAGFYYGSPCPAGSVCYSSRDSSTVIPARGPYSVRFTDYGGNPLYDFYGLDIGLGAFGSGNPGDDNVQNGVNIDLVSKSSDNMTAVVRTRNYSVDMHHSVASMEIMPGQYEVRYTTVVQNLGSDTANNLRIIYNLDTHLNFTKFEAVTGSAEDVASPQGMIKVYNIPSLAPGKQVTVTLFASYSTPVAPSTVGLDTSTRIEGNDGQLMRGPAWLSDTLLPAASRLFAPIIAAP